MHAPEMQEQWRGNFIRVMTEGRYEWVERTNVSGIVVIIPITDDGKVILIQQYRLPMRGHCIELPAGLAGDIAGQEEELMMTAALRELEEETGYTAVQMDMVTEGPPTPGLTTEVLTFYVARGLARVHDGGGDDTEDIGVREVPLDEVDGWLESQRTEGIMVDPKVFIGLYFAKQIWQSWPLQ